MRIWQIVSQTVNVDIRKPSLGQKKTFKRTGMGGAIVYNGRDAIFFRQLQLF